MSSTTKTALRVGRISYLNCAPFYEGLEQSLETPFEFKESYPQAINQAMQEGLLDIAPVSSFEYLKHQNLYQVLPGVSISTREYARSVLLFSKVKLDDLKGKTLALTHESASSSVLLQLLLQERFGAEQKFVVTKLDPEKALERFDGVLAIGDKALFFETDAFVYKYDLGELWWKVTGKPFCFALWVVRKSFAQENTRLVQNFSEALRCNVAQNLEQIELLVESKLSVNVLDKQYAKIVGYLSSLLYNLNEDVLSGLKEYYKQAYEKGFSKEPKPLDFFE